MSNTSKSPNDRGERSNVDGKHSGHPADGDTVDQPPADRDTRDMAHGDARKNVGNGSNDLDRAPIDNREHNIPRPRPRDNI